MLGIYIFGSNEETKVYKFDEKDILWNRYIEHYDDIHDAITAFQEEISKLSFNNIWMIGYPHCKPTIFQKQFKNIPYPKKSYSNEVKYIPDKKSDFILLAEYHYDKKSASSNITNKKGGIDINLSFRNDKLSLVREGYKQTFNTNIGGFQYIYDTIYKTGVNAKLLIHDSEFSDMSKLQNEDMTTPISFIIENPVIMEYHKHKK